MSPSKCLIEFSGSISHRVGWLVVHEQVPLSDCIFCTLWIENSSRSSYVSLALLPEWRIQQQKIQFGNLCYNLNTDMQKRSW